MEERNSFVVPKVDVHYFTVEDILTTSSATIAPTGPIDPELPPDDDF